MSLIAVHVMLSMPFVVHLDCWGNIGETLRELRTRICKHRSAIRCGDVSNPVAQHFKAVFPSPGPRVPQALHIFHRSLIKHT